MKHVASVMTAERMSALLTPENHGRSAVTCASMPKSVFNLTLPPLVFGFTQRFIAAMRPAEGLVFGVASASASRGGSAGMLLAESE